MAYETTPTTQPGVEPRIPPGVDADRADALIGYVSTARWFAGKGRAAELASLTALPWLTEVDEWPAVRIEIAEIVYRPEEDPDPESDGEAGSRWPSELYQLVVVVPEGAGPRAAATPRSAGSPIAISVRWSPTTRPRTPRPPGSCCGVCWRTGG